MIVSSDFDLKPRSMHCILKLSMCYIRNKVKLKEDNVVNQKEVNKIRFMYSPV